MIAINKLKKRKQNTIINQLTKTKQKVSKSWKRYQKQKATIKRRYKTKEIQDKYIKQLLQKTKNNNSGYWGDYQGKKYTIVYKDKLPLRLFKTKFDKRTVTKYLKSKVDIDKANKNINLLIQKDKKLKYILIDFVFENDELGTKRVVSNSYTPEGFERVKNDNLYEALLQSSLGWKDSDKLEGFTFKYYTIRTTSKLPESKIGKVHRSY